MKRSVLIVGVVVLAFLLPTLATAAVIVNNGIALNLTPTHKNLVYLARGPGYPIANNSGFIGVSGDNSQYTNLSINLTSVPGSGYIILTNVLQIYNSTTAIGVVNIWLNGTLPAGITVYESDSPISFSGASVSGAEILGDSQITSGPIHLTNAGVAGYLAFKLQGATFGQASLTLQYTVT